MSLHYNRRVRYILSLDEGTTTARAALYDREGKRLAMAAIPTPCRYPESGWVEQDASQIWTAQLDAVRRTMAEIGAQPLEIAAIGVTNQRETTVVWDRHTGVPVAPAIVWQCRRTAERCKALAASSDGAWVAAKTGLVIDAYFSGSKVEWILDHTAAGAGRGGGSVVWEHRLVVDLELVGSDGACDGPDERIAHDVDGFGEWGMG